MGGGRGVRGGGCEVIDWTAVFYVPSRSPCAESPVSSCGRREHHPLQIPLESYQPSRRRGRGGVLPARQKGREGGVLPARQKGREGGVLPARQKGREGGVLPARQKGREGGVLPARQKGREGGVLPARQKGREGGVLPAR